ncbi:unnamed protein product [Echinostoma caproni]|uniref:Dynein assembly factor 1, axonemal homolog n=1 Tax=Echinostoma caproni TaxID=27848 RepID=A0A183AJ59_9TREM|nr:unnamed protein product [Echinostoma caproni]
MYNFLRQGFEGVPTVTGPHGEIILNLSKRELDRIEPVPSNVNVLILDHNYIRRLENLGNIYDLQQTMDQLEGNINLKHLDLSENCITQLSDITNLRKLTTLLLHGNRISSLEKASNYLPKCLEIFSLASNVLADINEVGVLVSPREYEPHVLTALPSLRILDGAQVVRNNALRLVLNHGGLTASLDSWDSQMLREEHHKHKNIPQQAVPQPLPPPPGPSHLDEAGPGRYVAGVTPIPPTATITPPGPFPVVHESSLRGSCLTESNVSPGPPRQPDTRDPVGLVRPSNLAPVLLPHQEQSNYALSDLNPQTACFLNATHWIQLGSISSANRAIQLRTALKKTKYTDIDHVAPENNPVHSTAVDYAYSTKPGCSFDDIPVASVWALTNMNAALTTRDTQPSCLGDEAPVLSKPNGYPDRGQFGPRHISDNDFFLSTSTRASHVQGQVNGRDPSTASSQLMSESVYLPVANTSLSPDQPPPGIDSIMSRSTPLCALGRPPSVADPARLSRTSAITDSLDLTGASQELESSRAVLRLNTSSRNGTETLHSSYNMIPMNKIFTRPSPSVVPPPGSPSDLSTVVDIGPKSVPLHHSMIDSVHLLNDEEEEDDNDDINTVDINNNHEHVIDSKEEIGTMGQKMTRNDSLEEHVNGNDFELETDTIKRKSNDPSESGLARSRMESATPPDESDHLTAPVSVHESPLSETSSERIFSTPVATMIPAGSRPLHDTLNTSGPSVLGNELLRVNATSQTGVVELKSPVENFILLTTESVETYLQACLVVSLCVLGLIASERYVNQSWNNMASLVYEM